MNRKSVSLYSFGPGIAVAAMTLGGLAFLSGCTDFDFSSLAGESNDIEATNGDAPCNLTGTWVINETAFSDCGDDGSTTDTYQVTQTGSSVTVRSNSRNITLSGTLVGNTLNLQGSYPEDGGTTTVTGSNITVGPACDTLSGTTSFIFSDLFESCSGTTALSGNRL